MAPVLGEARSGDQPCVLGSVKANIGHLEAAAGVASLVKVLLCLKHGEIPAQPHFEKLNPHISLEKTPLVIPSERQPWLAGEQSRFAGVSSFGFGGTNAHLILEEAPQRQPSHNEIERPLHVLALSTKSASTLKELARRFENHLATHPDEALAAARTVGCFHCRRTSHRNPEQPLAKQKFAEGRVSIHRTGFSVLRDGQAALPYPAGIPQDPG